MRVRVLGCSGSIAAGSRTTSFLVDDGVLIDAGTGVGDLTLDEMARIGHVFVTHSHLDHVLAIGLLADSVTRRRRAADLPAIRVHALPETLDALRRHVFNDVIWPDFTRLPDAQHPMLELVPLAVGDNVAVGALRVEALPASHSVPACGYAVHDAEAGPGTWVYTGDTGPNEALWRRLALIDVRALVIETAFSDAEAPLARLSRHLCPSLLGEGLAQLATPTEVYITHIKPGEVEAVMAEVGALATRHHVRALVGGEELHVPG
jgi:ribonuclease BN (tRNA processing enzyme)